MQYLQYTKMLTSKHQVISLYESKLDKVLWNEEFFTELEDKMLKSSMKTTKEIQKGSKKLPSINVHCWEYEWSPAACKECGRGKLLESCTQQENMQNVQGNPERIAKGLGQIRKSL